MAVSRQGRAVQSKATRDSFIGSSTKDSGWLLANVGLGSRVNYPFAREFWKSRNVALFRPI